MPAPRTLPRPSRRSVAQHSARLAHAVAARCEGQVAVRLAALLERDRAWVERLNRSVTNDLVRVALLGISRFGDGVGWYLLMAALPLVAGAAGWACLRDMAAVGAVDVAIYWLLKRCTARPRPFTCCGGLHVQARVLDRFSFPSGHTLHAVAFAIIVTYHFPGMALALVPFAILTGFSRVALGLHYPSDVAAGSVIGASVATVAILIV
jgi:undecaprenyl-diphosphatase